MSVDRSYVERNEVVRERMRQMVARLSEEDLARPLEHGGWTVGATLAHLAHWDRHVLATVERWDREGIKDLPTDANAVNQDALPHWLAMSPREAAREALEAAEALDRKLAALPPEQVSGILALGRPRLLDRSRHRGEHLDQIERALVD
jgi:uncharacterized damage-inducible protein DinB